MTFAAKIDPVVGARAESPASSERITPELLRAVLSEARLRRAEAQRALLRRLVRALLPL